MATRQLGRYCGRVGNLVPLVSSTVDMKVKFKTDSSVNRTGFAVDFQAGIKVCFKKIICLRFQNIQVFSMNGSRNITMTQIFNHQNVL